MTIKIYPVLDKVTIIKKLMIKYPKNISYFRQDNNTWESKMKYHIFFGRKITIKISVSMS